MGRIWTQCLEHCRQMLIKLLCLLHVRSDDQPTIADPRPQLLKHMDRKTCDSRSWHGLMGQPYISKHTRTHIYRHTMPRLATRWCSINANNHIVLSPQQQHGQISDQHMREVHRKTYNRVLNILMCKNTSIYKHKCELFSTEVWHVALAEIRFP